MQLRIFSKTLGSGCSTAVEHTPAEQNSWVRGFDSRQVLGFFLLLSSVMCPYTGPSRRCSVTGFSYWKKMPSCAARSKTLMICLFYVQAVGLWLLIFCWNGSWGFFLQPYRNLATCYSVAFCWHFAKTLPTPQNPLCCQKLVETTQGLKLVFLLKRDRN